MFGKIARLTKLFYVQWKVKDSVYSFVNINIGTFATRSTPTFDFISKFVQFACAKVNSDRITSVYDVTS